MTARHTPYQWPTVALLWVLACSGCTIFSPVKWAGVKRVQAAGQGLPVDVAVVPWTSRHGFSAYRADGTGHFGVRGNGPGIQPQQNAAGKQWTLDALRQYVDLIVLHYDSVGNSRGCFAVLQRRGLSCHFLIDTDGTIYQTLDLRERAWHATIANDRSIGIEIAHTGAVPLGPGRPAGVIAGTIHGKRLQQTRFTEAQYEALARLVAGLTDAFPNIALTYPRDGGGSVLPGKLPAGEFESFRGILGHFHVQENKIDPGPAFDWARLVREAAALRSSAP